MGIGWILKPFDFTGRCLGVLNAVNAGIAVIGEDYDLKYINPYLKKRFGIKNEDYKNKKCFEVLFGKKTICLKCVLRRVIETKRGMGIHGEYETINKNIYFKRYISPIQTGKGGGLNGFLETFIDITKEKEKQKELEETVQKLKKTSLSDSLTGLYNHGFFKRRLEEFYKNFLRYGEKFSLAMLDIDFFKKINDSFGHLAGDFILKKFAFTLENNLRENDFIARYGGEEFAVIFLNQTKKEARASLLRIKEIIKNEPFHYFDKIIKVNFSGGVCSVDEKEFKGIDGIIKLADSRLYKAKNTGRDKIVTGVKNE